MLESADPRRVGVRTSGWSFDKVPYPRKFCAWIAGETFGLYGHHLGAHKPCCSLYTNGAVQCPGCAKGRPVTWLGYLPLYTAAGKQVVVGIKDYTHELMVDFLLHQAVKVGRDEGPSASVWVLREKGTPNYRATSPARREGAILTEWLFRLWGYEEFAAYCRSHVRVQANPDLVGELAPPTPALAAQEETPPDSEGAAKLRALMERDRGTVKSPREVSEAGEYIRELPVYQRLAPQAAAKNGQHTKRKP